MLRGKTCKPPNGRWRSYGKRLRLWRIAPILTVALFAISCSTTRKTQTEHKENVKTAERHDTVATVIRQIVREAIPMSLVEMEIPMDSLRDLPEGASFQKRNGQANASVSTQGNNVVVRATCDSLQREVDYYAELYYSTLEELEEKRESTEEREEKGCRHIPLLTTIFAIGAGLIIGTTATLIIKTTRNG